MVEQCYVAVLMADITPPPIQAQAGCETLDTPHRVLVRARGNAGLFNVVGNPTPSLHTLHSALTRLSVNNTPSCMDKLRILFNDSQNTEPLPSPDLKTIRDSAIHLEALLSRLSSLVNASRTKVTSKLVCSSSTMLQVCASIFPVCKDNQVLLPCKSACGQTQSLVSSLQHFINISKVPILSILSETTKFCSFTSNTSCLEESSNSRLGYILTKPPANDSETQPRPPAGGFCLNLQCQSPLLSRTSNRQHWDETVQEILRFIHDAVIETFPKSTLRFNGSILPCGRRCSSVAIGFSEGHHRPGRILLTLTSTTAVLSVLFSLVVFYYNLRDLGHQYARRMLIMFSVCAATGMIPFIFSARGNKQLTCHPDGTLVTRAPQSSYTCGYVGWHVQFFGTLCLGYGLFMSYAWQQLCAHLKKPSASSGLHFYSPMTTWWRKHQVDVFSSAGAFIPALALSLAVVGQDGYEGSPILGLCWRSLKRGFINYYSWFTIAATGTSALLLLCGIYVLLQNFGVLGTLQLLRNADHTPTGQNTGQPSPRDRTLIAIKRLSRLMLVYLFLNLGSCFAYLYQAVYAEVSADDWAEQELRHTRCILTSCRPDACPPPGKRSVTSFVVGIAVSFMAIFMLTTWAFSKVYLANVPGIKLLVNHQKPSQESQSTDLTGA